MSWHKLITRVHGFKLFKLLILNERILLKISSLPFQLLGPFRQHTIEVNYQGPFCGNFCLLWWRNYATWVFWGTQSGQKIDQCDAHTGFLRYWEQRAGRERTFGQNFHRNQGQVWQSISMKLNFPTSFGRSVAFAAHNTNTFTLSRHFHLTHSIERFVFSLHFRL